IQNGTPHLPHDKAGLAALTMSFTSRPDSLDDCKISADAPSQTQTQRSNRIGTDQARIGDMGADKLCGGLTTTAYFEQLQNAVQTVLEPLQVRMQHFEMEIGNLRDCLFNKTAYRRSDNIRPLRVLCTNGNIALPPPAEFPDNVWHFWTLPRATISLYPAQVLSPTSHQSNTCSRSSNSTRSMAGDFGLEFDLP
ncbi:hypothetical protein LTR17_027836, partial [Elasticomyces elasticus]